MQLVGICRLALMGALPSSVFVGCASGQLGKAVAPDMRLSPAARPNDKPLLVDFGPNDRTMFNTALTGPTVSGSDGMVHRQLPSPMVFRYANGKLEHLPACRADGTYSYHGQSMPQVGQNDSVISSQSELHMRLPMFGLNHELFGGAIKSSGALHVHLEVVGQYSTNQMTITKEALQGTECYKATHVATHVTVGAFQVFTQSSGSVAGTASVPLGPTTQVNDGVSRNILNYGGDFAQCAKTVQTDQEPPLGCDAALSLSLVALDPDAADLEPKRPSLAGPILTGIGVASLIASGATGAVAYAKNRDFDSSPDCTNNKCDASRTNDVEMYNALRQVSGVTAFIGGGLVATGVILMLTSSHPEQPPQYAIVTTPGGLTLKGGF